MIYIERKERFSAAHQLYNPNWTVEQNDAVFGKCANKNFHGHNFTLIVTVKGEINPDTGFVMNLVDLKKIIQEQVIEKVDHANLNHDVDFMLGKFASTEVLAEEFWKILEPAIAEHGCQLHRIRLEETINNAVEYFG
ncbi:6-pyruvoyl trahydropterin synthase family protein [Croceimicrobium hydrocarbonivorans]|uniref:6-carboxy-5,6,7,8-tetrahydropterin synthase n=1 Tax=Croceimicrobium hydrocarbonivorans TaxID=2761580 RepID=A0A7H0VAZ4_9FLAO|nr:6-carboxytetrahydropterin synthase [Croceimicrobium hydrocarbonivorans]QNR22892.1 6-carboxytetrahydropterin synthase [Croceimicrobium hydrocarbonivorans]|tara:strand:- start:64 stop:474 length:411 start_codon:yes stop_codon:yes gene_type:complete